MGTRPQRRRCGQWLAQLRHLLLKLAGMLLNACTCHGPPCRREAGQWSGAAFCTFQVATAAAHNALEGLLRWLPGVGLTAACLSDFIGLGRRILSPSQCFQSQVAAVEADDALAGLLGSLPGADLQSAAFAADIFPGDESPDEFEEELLMR